MLTYTVAVPYRPILPAVCMLHKRISSHYYKNVMEFREDMGLMFNNAQCINAKPHTTQCFGHH